ncbi:putative membrane protein [Streptomyces himastatinicus ATCC 53653]|uniref:Putative membrane protein n=1 Tax=Streptomyces himastatinicus ATCC 53653 TaxID=457427 RepID=D9WS65_9ACTN|nr:YoaK family protein [Streptomyces himastatinicus]EFL28309.1 putative membrane protein [Streptomyces himastatinicus ATCC 53653]
MRRLLRDAARTFRPDVTDRHGPLPPLLLTLTVVTGLVDAVSYLGLGHVFVANMTGNVVFLGFALAGAPGLSAPAALVSLGSFLTGALAGGRAGARPPTHRGRLLAVSTGTQTALIAAATAVSALAPVGQAATGVRYALIVLLGLGMGLQNAVVRRLGVPDLTTTVLTLTLTGLAADSAATGRTATGRTATGRTATGGTARRVLSVLAMFLGALTGAWLFPRWGIAATLGPALTLLAVTAVVAHRLSADDAVWARPGS